MEQNPGLFVGLFCCVGPLLIFLSGAAFTLTFQRLRSRWVIVERRSLRESEEIGYRGASAAPVVEERRPAAQPSARQQPANGAGRRDAAFRGGPQAQSRLAKRFEDGDGGGQG